jgi:hypothetical protein
MNWLPYIREKIFKNKPQRPQFRELGIRRVLYPFLIMVMSLKITSRYIGNMDIHGIKIRENIRDLRAIRGKKKLRNSPRIARKYTDLKFMVLFVVYYISYIVVPQYIKIWPQKE